MYCYWYLYASAAPMKRLLDVYPQSFFQHAAATDSKVELTWADVW